MGRLYLYLFIILLTSKSWLIWTQGTATSGQRDRGVVAVLATKLYLE